MEYNDIIIITLLVVIIGIILVKTDYVNLNRDKISGKLHLNENLNRYNNFSNSMKSNVERMPKQSINDKINNIKNDSNYDNYTYNMTEQNYRKQKLDSNDNIRGYNKYGDKVDKYGKNNNSIDPVRKKNSGTNKMVGRIASDSDDEQYSKLEQISRNNDNRNHKSIKKNNKKIVIDDYSEKEDIKSLNSMDNTLSDIVSIVENVK
jgi:hypothetical protein